MPIFQKSIVDKYVATIDVDVIDKAFESYKHIYSTQKIQRIKKLKEEQYQGGFLKDIFGSVLGYTIDPEIGYNLELEKKNETNSKKADGAILKDEKVLGVIELKSNTTKNLESIKDQAFGYKNNHKGCKYVISSNFHKLRFYVDDATEYEEFDLYNLDKETFKRFYLFLRKEGLLDKNIPKLLKEETKFHEENISKQLYKDYSAFKNKFFENIVKNNPQYDKLLLFKKSQKFLDRILFVLFAEDKELIPTNAISKIVESWVYADDLHYKPLYELFTILFEHLNVGHTYKSGYEIPAYNGGLFAPDDVLDNLKVDDEILKDDLLILSKYDFNTDVDVNILGHIFEHSLSEIEEIEAQLKGEEVDKSKGKRKKDGVFYTPKYITKYIVDNTVGKLCSEKKDALGLGIDFDIQEYQKSDGSVNQKGRKLFHILESYKEWLLTLKILDPACGSGAFLNQALSFLIEEHKNIDDLIAELTNTPLRIFDTDKAILENNIFGVDINDESVEIAKLSLWLRTAQKGRKLSNLNNNIKCGNSLIDDPAVAGDKAFKWEDEFPEIFAKGGFDVVIGNPPYVFARDNISKELKGYYAKNYVSAEYQVNTYLLFIEQTIKLIRDKANYGLIIPNAWLMVGSATGLRNYILQNCSINEIINLAGYSFEGVNVETIIILATNTKQKQEDNSIKVLLSDDKEFKYSHDRKQIDFENNEGFEFKVFSDETSVALTKKLKTNSKNLDDLVLIKAGLKAYEKNKGEPRQTAEDVKSRPFDYTYQFDENTHKYLEGKDVGRYFTNWSGQYLQYGKHLAASRTSNLFDGEKVIIREITGKFPKSIIATYSDKYYLFNMSNISIIEREEFNISLKYVVAILNSQLMAYYFVKNTAKAVRKMFPKIILNDLRKFPFKEISEIEQEPFVNKADTILNLNENLQNISSKFIGLLHSELSIEKLTKKIGDWYTLEWSGFEKELKRIKRVLTGEQKEDWYERFNRLKSEIQNLKAQIDKTEKEIDAMVYQLYGLTDVEIAIVENS